MIEIGAFNRILRYTSISVYTECTFPVFARSTERSSYYYYLPSTRDVNAYTRRNRAHPFPVARGTGTVHTWRPTARSMNKLLLSPFVGCAFLFQRLIICDNVESVVLILVFKLQNKRQMFLCSC